MTLPQLPFQEEKELIHKEAGISSSVSNRSCFQMIETITNGIFEGKALALGSMNTVH